MWMNDGIQYGSVCYTISSVMNVHLLMSLLIFLAKCIHRTQADHHCLHSLLTGETLSHLYLFCLCFLALQCTCNASSKYLQFCDLYPSCSLHLASSLCHPSLSLSLTLQQSLLCGVLTHRIPALTDICLYIDHI